MKIIFSFFLMTLCHGKRDWRNEICRIRGQNLNGGSNPTVRVQRAPETFFFDEISFTPAVAEKKIEIGAARSG